MYNFQNKLSDYFELKENDGLEAAELYLSDLNINLSMNLLLYHYHEDAKNSEERKKLIIQIRSLLKKRLENVKQKYSLSLLKRAQKFDRGA